MRALRTSAQRQAELLALEAKQITLERATQLAEATNAEDVHRGAERVRQRQRADESTRHKRFRWLRDVSLVSLGASLSQVFLFPEVAVVFVLFSGGAYMWSALGN